MRHAKNSYSVNREVLQLAVIARSQMLQPIFRCPYCVLGDVFRPMVAHPEGRFICSHCSHVANPCSEDFQCSCPKCLGLRAFDYGRSGSLMTGSETGGSEKERRHNTGRRVERSGSSSARMLSEGSTMTTPDSPIKDEVRLLMDIQIETLRQSATITSSQLREYRWRAKQIRTLCQELDRIAARSVMEKRLEKAS